MTHIDKDPNGQTGTYTDEKGNVHTYDIADTDAHMDDTMFGRNGVQVESDDEEEE